MNSRNSASVVRDGHVESDRSPQPDGLVVGFVGGVGAGKSHVASMTAAALRDAGVDTIIVDGDRIGHETLRDPVVISAIENEFASVVIDGEVDRRALGRLVFGPSEQAQANRARLEAIMHPVMRTIFEARSRYGVASGHCVLFDAAILFEAAWDDLCDVCVFVDVGDAVRKTRALARGWSAERWQQTEASQWPIQIKRRAVEGFGEAGFVVENDNDEENAGQKVASWIVSRLNPRGTSDVNFSAADQSTHSAEATLQDSSTQ